MMLITNKWLVLSFFIILSMLYIEYGKNREPQNPLEKQQQLLKAQSRPLVSYIASWQDSSTIQLVQDALPRKPLWNEADPEEERLKNMVALVDKVIVIPSLSAAHDRNW